MPEKTIQIKEPNSPASDAQMNLIAALAEAGVVSQEEFDALSAAPTKQAASDLIGAHAEEQGFKDVKAARDAERAAARAEASAAKRAERAAARGSASREQGDKKAFANVKMHAAFVHPYEMEAKDGRTFDKAFVNFPEGMKVNDVDLGGFSCDVFMTDHMKQQKMNNEPVTLGFKADEPVQVWHGHKGDADYKRFEVNPWELAKAIKANNQEYKETKQAERDAQERPDLDEKANATREAAEAKSGQELGERAEQAR